MRSDRHDSEGRRGGCDGRERREGGRDGGRRGRCDSGADVGRIGNASPAAEDSLGEAAPHGVAEGHAQERREAGDGPRRAVQERDGDRLAGTAPKGGEEIEGGRAKGAKGGDGDDDQAHARGEVAVLSARRALSDGGVRGEAATVGVVGGDVGGAARVKGLDVDETVRPRAVKASDHSIGAVAEASAGAGHELLKRGASRWALGKDVRRAHQGIKPHDEGMDRGVMAGAREADAVLARGEVAVERADGALSGRHVGSAGGADGDVTVAVDGREKEEVDGEGDGEGGGLLHKGEEGGAAPLRGSGEGHTAPEGEWARRGAAVEEAGAASGGGEG